MFLSICSNCPLYIFYPVNYGSGAMLLYRPRVYFVPDDSGYVPTVFLFAVGIAAAAFAIHIFRQGKVYGCCRSLQRGFDERAEQNICQRVEPGIHRDHICTNDTGIGGIDGDSFSFTLLPVRA